MKRSPRVVEGQIMDSPQRIKTKDAVAGSLFLGLRSGAKTGFSWSSEISLSRMAEIRFQICVLSAAAFFQRRGLSPRSRRRFPYRTGLFLLAASLEQGGHIDAFFNIQGADAFRAPEIVVRHGQQVDVHLFDGTGDVPHPPVRRRVEQDALFPRDGAISRDGENCADLMLAVIIVIRIVSS